MSSLYELYLNNWSLYTESDSILELKLNKLSNQFAISFSILNNTKKLHLVESNRMLSVDSMRLITTLIVVLSQYYILESYQLFSLRKLYTGLTVTLHEGSIKYLLLKQPFLYDIHFLIRLMNILQYFTIMILTFDL